MNPEELMRIYRLGRNDTHGHAHTVCMCSQKGNERDLVIDSCLRPGTESKGCTHSDWQGSDGEDSSSELISSTLPLKIVGSYWTAFIKGIIEPESS